MNTPAALTRVPVRFTNDPSLAGVLAELESGREAIAQFSTPIFDDATLEQLNAWSRRFGPALQVRFFGFGPGMFDCQLLRGLPDVANLEVDSHPQVAHVEAIQELQNLQALRIGIDKGVPDDFLAAPAFRGLRSLILSGDLRSKMDLAPVRDVPGLEFLHVTGFTCGIETLSGHPSLARLSLSSIGRRQSIAFVGKLPRLHSLQLMLGGRDDLSEVIAPGLERLEIVRVQGLERVDLSGVPSLRELVIQDQPRLASLHLRPAKSLAKLHLATCPKLTALDGLAGLTTLASLHAYRIGLSLDALVAEGLPPELKSLTYPGTTAREDRAHAQRLRDLGFAVD